MRWLSLFVVAAFVVVAACSGDPTAPTNFTDEDAVAVFSSSPSPPTEGGNGAGKSGNCTGDPDDRPSSCHDQGGPGNQPGPP
jgi:hypothetical protein